MSTCETINGHHVEDCPDCDGQGWWIKDTRGPRSDDWYSESVDCEGCEGTGKVETDPGGCQVCYPPEGS